MKLAMKITRGIRYPLPALKHLWFKFLRLIGSKRLLKVQLKDAKSSLYVDPQDDGISKDLFVWGRREVEATAMFKALLKPGQTIVDLGANIGYYVVIEAEHIGSSGRILAIEASPHNVELLKKNVALNEFDSIVHTEWAAISNVTGTATLHVANKSNLHTLERTPFMDNYVEFRETIDVSTYRLDDYLAKHGVPLSQIDIIRMDIEGYEIQAVEGMMETIKASPSLTIFVELHPNLILESRGSGVYEAFIGRLEKLGFRIRGAALSRTSREDELLHISEMRELAEIRKPVEVILSKA